MNATDSNISESAKKLILAMTLLGALALPTAASAGHWRGDSFHSPTGNLRCIYVSGAVHCGSIASGLWIALGQHGTWRSSGPTYSAQYSHILRYGETWSADGSALSCKSLFAGMSCANRDGYRFVLSRLHFSVWYRYTLILSR